MHGVELAHTAQCFVLLTSAHVDIFKRPASTELFGTLKTLVPPLKRYHNDDTVNKALQTYTL